MALRGYPADARVPDDHAAVYAHDERQVMAQELHDVVAGHVSAIAIRAEAALSTPPDEKRDRAAPTIVRSASLQAHEALRSMISVLREPGATLAPPLQLDTIPALVHAGEEAGLRVRYTNAIERDAVEPWEHTAAVIVRESLTNCLRHAPGSEVDVVLAADEDTVTVRVDSVGGAAASHPPLTGSGTGLAMLAERTRALGGRLRAHATDDGWSVHAELPRKAAS